MSLLAGRELELDIEGLAAGGSGVGRDGGRAIFVPWTAPGDRVRVRASEVRRRFARAEPRDWIREGPGRREPPCPYFARCGGCLWLHLEERVQSEARVRLLRDALQRIGRLQTLPPIERLASPRSLGYRARARVAHAAGRVGFRAYRSREVVGVERCAVLDEPTQAELERLAAQPPEGVGEREIRGFGDDVDGLVVSRGVFVQANRSLWRAWVAKVADCCGEGRLLLELFAGVGFYTVALERRFERVIAVESDRSAQDLRVNTRAEVHAARVEQFLASPPAHPSPDVVLLNPPRTGCAAGVMEVLGRYASARIVYVSCDPATLARDLTRLGTGYAITRIVVLDALPQTHHVESIVVLERS